MKTKCSKKNGFCKTLSDRLGEYNGSGLVVLNTINSITGKHLRSMPIYKKKKTEAGLVLNFCPWCGENLEWSLEDNKK